MKSAHQSIQLHVTENQNKFHAPPPHPIKNPKTVVKSWVIPPDSFLFRKLRRAGPLPYNQIPRNLARLVYDNVRCGVRCAISAFDVIGKVNGVFQPSLFGDMMDERWSWAKTHDDKSGHGTACALAGLDFVLHNCKKHRGQPCIVSMSIGIIEDDDPQPVPITSDEDVTVGQTFEDEGKVVPRSTK
ncbi:hypothetical protein H0H93_007088 [Arthromyces matolae]|nr:hypothetical protein H0H93_007088 [Arthromyces matolae]